MSSRRLLEHLSVEDYLEGEKASQVRHEYIAGQVYAMAGASRKHNSIALNLASRIRSRIMRGHCQVFMSDVKVRIDVLDVFYYPDVVVSCEPEDSNDYFVSAPCLIIEVTSPSTAAIDRREKLLSYQKIDSLREYLLVSQDEIKVDVYRRDDEGRWWVETLGEKDELRMESVDLSIPVSELYEDI